MAKDYPIKVKFMGVDLVSPTLAKMGSKVSRFTHDASMKFRKLDRTLSDVSKKLTSGLKTGFQYATIGAAAFAGALYKVMGAFSIFENAQAAFTPLMGGAEGAIKLVARLKEEARTTPFEFENLANVAQQLLPMMNRDIDKTANTMRMMGDMAGGNVEKMQRITNGYMKALLKGKLDQETLNIITEAGVPIQKELLEMTGVTREKFSAAMKSGKIGVKELDEAIVKMTSKGGLFYKGMDLASQTLSGTISTLKDDVTDAAAELGTQLAPAVKELVTLASSYIPKIKAWVIAHKDLIRTKAVAFVKAIPVYLEKIAYWGPKIAKALAFFYGFAAVTKGCSAALTGFNSIVNLTTKGTDKATGAVGKFGASLGVLQVALASYALGTLLYDNLVKPLIEAQDRMNKLTDDVDDTMKRDLTKRNKDQLLIDVEKSKKALDNAKAIDRSVNAPEGSEKIVAKREHDLKRLQNVLAWRGQMENIQKYAGSDNVSQGDVRGYSDASNVSWGDAPDWEVNSPQVTVAESSSETKIISEITIKDDTGKARITRGKNGQGGLNLVHTGGM